jgi:hypothetical protein
VRVNKIGVNKKLYSDQKYRVSVTERSHPKGVKSKITDRKLRKRVLARDVTVKRSKTGVKHRLGVLYIFFIYIYIYVCACVS